MSHRLEHLVSAQVQRSPDAGAIVDDIGSYSYAELDCRSNRLANALVAEGLKPNDRVCLLIPKSAEAIVTILAVLKSGAVYAPLDETSPSPRLIRMLRTLEPCWLVAVPECAGLVAECIGETRRALRPNIFWLGHRPQEFAVGTVLSEKDLETVGGEPPQLRDAPSDLAVILFTSGSTGDPKGVPLKQDAVAQFVLWSNTYFDLGPDDRVSCHPPLYFDASLWDIIRALSSGAELHLVPPRANLLPKLLAEFIRTSRLTQWDSVPSALTAMASRDVLTYGDFPELRKLIWYGEVFPTKALRYWMEHLPHVEFTNTYGPTETTITASYHTMLSMPADDGAVVPIGKAVPGKNLAVLDSNQRPVEPEVVGDLYIGGAGLSPGYWRDPNKTESAFLDIPSGSGERWYRTGDLARIDEAGLFHFHGRADRQIKSRGCRIELDEIAVALRRLSGLVESAVVAIPVAEFEGPRICAAYVLKSGVERSAVDLRTELAASLPSYMLPTRWLSLDLLPKNPNGKIDHRALEQRFLDQR
jgi:amino acid adenylation domain-containing protein